ENGGSRYFPTKLLGIAPASGLFRNTGSDRSGNPKKGFRGRVRQQTRERFLRSFGATTRPLDRPPPPYPRRSRRGGLTRGYHFAWSRLFPTNWRSWEILNTTYRAGSREPRRWPSLARHGQEICKR